MKRRSMKAENEEEEEEEPQSQHRVDVSKPQRGCFAWLRGRMINEVARGTPFLLWLQQYRGNPLVHAWLRGASALGDQWSYMVLLPACFWIGDVQLGTDFALVVLLGTFLGNFAKNLFALPRPPNPPVRNLQHAMRDFGFPSVHTLNAVTVSGVLLKYQWEVLGGRDMVLWSVLAAFWCISIPLSRMYVGVHSPLDCAGGATAGVILTVLWFQVVEQLNYWMSVSRAFLIPSMIAFGLISCTIHPRSHRPSPSYHHNIAVIGMIVGCVIGISQHPYTLMVARHVQGLPVIDVAPIALLLGLSRSATVALLRFLLGIALVLLVKVVTEPLLRGVFTVIFITPVLSTIKTWIALLLSPIVVPHPEALNNADFPLESFAQEVEQYQAQLEEENKSLRRRAVREASILSRVASHTLVGLTIVDWARAVFPLIGLNV